MPVISTLGAASSRGFGEFSSTGQAVYSEDVFSTYVYTGTQRYTPIQNDVPLGDTASWSSYSIGGISELSGMATDSFGNLYVCGYDNSNNGFVHKYGSSGVIQWRRQVSSAPLKGIAVDSSGNVFVIGYYTFDVIVIKYDSSGTLQWQKAVSDGGASEYGYGIDVDSSGKIYLACKMYDSTGAGNNYFAVFKLSSSATIEWSRRLEEGANSATCNSVKVDSSGNVYAVGQIVNASNGYFITTKIDSTGSLLWQRKLVSGNVSEALSVTVDGSSNVYSAGYYNNTTAVLAKYDSSGTLQWQRITKDTGASRWHAVSTDSNGDIYAVGYATNNAPANYMVVAKYNSSGSLQWQRVVGLSGTIGNAVSIDPNGNLYAGSNAVIVKLKSDGSTKSGNAGVFMAEGLVPENSGAATASTSTASPLTSSATISTSSATDSAGTLATTNATQKAVSGSAGLVWVKQRNGSADYYLFDTIRGVEQAISTNNTNASSSLANSVVSFNANGFSLGNDTSTNASAGLFTSWTWKEQPRFFDVVQYTGTGSAQSINHNLGSVPGMIIVKRTGSQGWYVYHRSVGNGSYIRLDDAGLPVSASGYWNNTTPTATQFTVGNAIDVNGNGLTYMAYVFAHDAGGFGEAGNQSISACGSFTSDGTGLGSADLGWEPQFVIIKDTTNTGSNWVLYDTVRGFVTDEGTSNYNAVLNPNSVNPEALTYGTRLTSTGISSILNANTTYIYYAVRRGPNRIPTDATKVFQPVVYTGTNVDNRLVNTTIFADLVWCRQRNDTVIAGMVVGDRMRGVPYLRTGTTAGVVTDPDSFMQPTVGYGSPFASMNGFGVGNDATSKLNISTVSSNQVAEAFKRSTGFFEMVRYTGTGANRTVSHPLGVVPELLIVKSESTRGWFVYSAPTGNTVYLNLNTTTRYTDTSTHWNNTTPTNSVFSLGTSADVNTLNTRYITYLFASCPGVSKVGSYIGTGTTLPVGCGFSSGSRLVLIKRVDSEGDWYLYDSARGINAGNDPYLLLNSTAAQVTNTDYVDPYSAGFEISSTAPAGLNEVPSVTWGSRDSTFGSSHILSAAYGNGVYAVGGELGKIATSTDTKTWTSRTSNFSPDTIYGLAYGAGIFVAVGSGGKISTSSDGITWTARTSGTTSTLYAVTYGNSLFVAVGFGGLILKSSDGISWSSQTIGSGTISNLLTVSYGNGTYLVAGNDATVSVYTSTDATNWTLRSTGLSAGTMVYASVYAGGSYFLLGNSSGEMRLSTDNGVSWNVRTSGFGTSAIRGMSYGSGVTCAVGAAGVVVTSTDFFATNTVRSTPTAYDLYSSTYGNGAFVAGGYLAYLINSRPEYLYLAIA